MKGMTFITAVLLLSLAGSGAHAFTVDRGYGVNDMVVGGYWSNGLALVAGEGYEELSDSFAVFDERIFPVDRGDRTALYSPGGGVYFTYFFTSIVGIEGGLGFLSKGIRFRWDDNKHKQRYVYMEIPVMVKIDIQHFQIAAGLALFINLAAKTTTIIEQNNVTETEKIKWEDDHWDHVHRANFGPKIVAGYAIPVGPIYIVPSFSWTIHLLNDLDNDEIARDMNESDTDFKMRSTNLMFNVGAEWAF